MTPLSTILALTDLSAPSRHAMVRAAMLAQESGTRLELLHVLEGGAADQLQKLLGQEAGAVTTRLLEHARETLTQMATQTCATRGVSPGIHVADGTLMKEISNHVDAIDPGLIVLGAHGSGFLRHMLLGSTAERLLRKTLRPLLVVRQVAHEPYRRLLLPVDFSPWSQAAIHFARLLAPNAELILFHAYEVPFEGKMRFAGVSDENILHYRLSAQQDARHNLETLAAQSGLPAQTCRCIVTHGDAVTRILEQEQEQDIDLIVMGKHGRGMTEELLLGSTTKYVLSQAGCDVLVTQAG